MTDPVLIALIAAVPPTLASVAALIVSIVTMRKTEKVHIATNSMKDALVAAALKEGHAAGVKDEKNAEAKKT